MAINNNINITIEAIDKTKKAIASVGNGFEKMNRSLQKQKENFQKVRNASTVALGVMGVGINKAIDNAVDLGESVNAVNVVFGEGSDEILKFGKTASTSVGLANAEFNQLATETGTLLKATGMNMNDVADSTIDLTKRASDLASVFNTDVEVAMSAINQAVRGETEAIRKFGSDVTDASLQTYLLSKGLDVSVSSLTQQEKTLLRVEKVMADTNQVQGDFINTADSLANRERIIAKQTADLSARFGELLIPIKETVFNALDPLLTRLNQFVTENPELTKQITLITAGFLGVVTVVTTLGALLGPLTAGVTALSGAFTLLLANPIGLFFAGIVTAGILVYKNWDLIVAKAGELYEYLSKVFGDLKNFFSGIWQSISDTAMSVVGGMVDWVTSKFEGLLSFVSGSINKIKSIGNTASDIAGSVSDTISGGISSAGDFVSGLFDGERALGGTVQSGKSYLVGERGPEMFTPSTTGRIQTNGSLGGSTNVNINMGGVVVKNEADENRLVKKIQEKLVKQMQNYKLGIS